MTTTQKILAVSTIVDVFVALAVKAGGALVLKLNSAMDPAPRIRYSSEFYTDMSDVERSLSSAGEEFLTAGEESFIESRGNLYTNKFLSDPLLSRSSFRSQMADATGVVDVADKEASVSKLTRFSNVSGKFAEGMNVVLMTGMTVFATIEMIHDFTSGASIGTEVCDVLQVASDAVMVFVGVASIAGTSLPIVGWIFATIGIVASFIEGFFRKKKLTPAETIVKDQIVPVIDPMDAPSQQWLDTLKKMPLGSQ